MSENVLVTYKDNIQIITLNRPKVKNALDIKTYVEITGILNRAADNDSVFITVITGSGDYFSSGNDLKSSLENAQDVFSKGNKIIKEFVDAFIVFPKVLVAIVNGPAIGIAATTLALYDVVFASEHAYFHTPFTKLGLIAEGCSTYTFPKLFGRQKASELLMLNYKMPSSEALKYGFVNEVFKPDEIERIWNKIYETAKLPKYSVLNNKKLMTAYEREELSQANVRETDELAKIWTSEEFVNNLVAFSSKNKNSKL